MKVARKSVLKTVPIRLEPFGMTLTGDGMRPLLLLKDQSGELTLPVPLSPLEAGVTLGQSSTAPLPSTTHQVTQLLLESMSVKITRCVFKELRSQNQIVELELTGHPNGTSKMRVRADAAMSLCLHLNVPLFASKEFIQKSRSTVVEMQGQAKALALNPKVLVRNHPYLM